MLVPGGPLKMLVELAQEREEQIPALVYEARPVRRDPSRGAALADDAAAAATGGPAVAVPPPAQQIATPHEGAVECGCGAGLCTVRLYSLRLPAACASKQPPTRLPPHPILPLSSGAAAAAAAARQLGQDVSCQRGKRLCWRCLGRWQLAG